jgi:hypothetical protein
MIFNKSGRKLKGFSFMYAQQSIGQASVYKYLGIIFKPSGSFLSLLLIFNCQWEVTWNFIYLYCMGDNSVFPQLLHCMLSNIVYLKVA